MVQKIGVPVDDEEEPCVGTTYEVRSLENNSWGRPQIVTILLLVVIVVLLLADILLQLGHRATLRSSGQATTLSTSLSTAEALAAYTPSAPAPAPKPMPKFNNPDLNYDSSIDEKQLAKWWNNEDGSGGVAREQFAHRADYFNFKGKAKDIKDEDVDKRIALWEKGWMTRFEWKDKTVIDYGIGAGALAAALLRDLGVKKYIGVDIAQKSLDATKSTVTRLGIADRAEFHLVPVNFKSLHPDIFVTLAVIQHFPNAAYVVQWFANLNDSGATEIWMQTRATSRPDIKEEHSTVAMYGTQLSVERVKELLPRYEVTYTGKVAEKTFYQAIGLRLK